MEASGDGLLQNNINLGVPACCLFQNFSTTPVGGMKYSMETLTWSYITAQDTSFKLNQD